MRSTFKVTFYVNKSKQKNGVVPVLGRITISGSIAQFSCKQTIDPKLWDVKANRATGRSKQSIQVNRTLDNIRAQVTKHYQRISDRVSYVNAEMVRNAWQGIGSEYESLLSALDKHNEEFRLCAGKDRSRNTLDKYLTVRKHLADFIKSKYRRSDLHLKEITQDFIKDFSLYLHLTLGLATSTARLYCIPLKMIVTKAHNNETIPADPFAYYHVPQEVKERGYLSEDELKVLVAHNFTNPRLEVVRDLFIFAVFTGLSYIDIKKLTAENIITTPDGSKWVATHREKTGTPVNVKLLEVPLYIIDKYNDRRKLHPVLSKVQDNLRDFVYL